MVNKELWLLRDDTPFVGFFHEEREHAETAQESLLGDAFFFSFNDFFPLCNSDVMHHTLTQVLTQHCSRLYFALLEEQ